MTASKADNMKRKYVGFELNSEYIEMFYNVAETVKHSSRFELFHFFFLSINDIGENCISSSNGNDVYEGSILPHSHSNFDKGYKVVSFYVDSGSLLERSYVLRNQGWIDEIGLYQRMIGKAKLMPFENIYILKGAFSLIIL